jgi:RND superfamily putative drug exporter
VSAGLAARIVAARRWLVPALLAAGLALVPLARRAGDALEASARIDGSESAQVADVLAARFESPFARTALVVVTGLPEPARPDGREALREIALDLGRVPGVTRTYSHRDDGDPLFRPATGREGTFLLVGLDGTPAERIVPRLRAAAAGLVQRLRARHPAVALRVTGEPALTVDLRQASAEEVRAREAHAVPVTAALLLVAFGAAAAALLAVASGGFAVVGALAAAALLGRLWPLSVTLESVVSMLGLGLGIDYALLTVTRFREALDDGQDAPGAAEEACRHAGRTVLTSAAPVAIGFGGLLAVPVGELRSMALGGLLVVVASVVVSCLALPGVLALVGRRVDWGRWPRRNHTDGADAWTRWARWVVARPWTVLAAAGLPVLLLASAGPRLETGIPDGGGLPASIESAAALQDLRAMGRAGVVQEVQVLLDLPEDAFALGAEGWEAQRRLVEALESDPRVQRVRALRGVAGSRADDRAYVSLMPGSVKRIFVSGEGDKALVSVVPRETATPRETAALVRDLRRLDAAAVTGLAGARVRVGGLPAVNADYEDAIAGRFAGVVAVVVLGTLAALAVAFRSVLVPLKAVALNLLSVGAAFGALSLVFGTVFPAVPVLVFTIVFGLSMDYEVFLLCRVAEARRRGLDDNEAVVEALARTGGVITSAAAVMVAVFGAFAFSRLLLVQMLGVALAVAVAVDATIIRMALAPALLRLAGRWNWWPGGRRPVAVSARPCLDDRAQAGQESGLDLVGKEAPHLVALPAQDLRPGAAHLLVARDGDGRSRAERARGAQPVEVGRHERAE